MILVSMTLREREAMPRKALYTQRLADAFRPGSYGASNTSGINARVERSPLIFELSAWSEDIAPLNAGALEQLGLALTEPGKFATNQKVSMAWSGFRTWYLQYHEPPSTQRMQDTARWLSEKAGLVDKSAGLVRLLLSGESVAAVLARGAELDFRSDEFAVGCAISTQINYIAVHLSKIDIHCFAALVPRSELPSFWHWFLASAVEFGVVVEN